jgi:hypothetical protein
LPELLAASIHGSPDVDIVVPNGTYTLQLLLYEGWRSRSADIVIEGKTIKEKYEQLQKETAELIKDKYGVDTNKGLFSQSIDIDLVAKVLNIPVNILKGIILCEYEKSSFSKEIKLQVNDITEISLLQYLQYFNSANMLNKKIFDILFTVTYSIYLSTLRKQIQAVSNLTDNEIDRLADNIDDYYK